MEAFHQELESKHGGKYSRPQCCLWAEVIDILTHASEEESHDIVEAHCYFVDIGRTDREQIRSRINNNDCRTFRPRRPLSTAYRTKETAV